MGKKRNKGKRHKNSPKPGRESEAGWRTGSSDRNRNWARCTHFDRYGHGQCQRMVQVKKGERPICSDHLSRHRNGAKDRAIFRQYQDEVPGGADR